MEEKKVNRRAKRKASALKQRSQNVVNYQSILVCLVSFLYRQTALNLILKLGILSNSFTPVIPGKCDYLDAEVVNTLQNNITAPSSSF